MAINFNNPALSNTYSALLTDIRDMQSALATMNFTGATGTPTGSISWSTGNNRFERWNGSAWAAAMPNASTTVVGPTQLHDGIASTSTVLAATANAVKTAYDAAVLASSTSQAGRVELATDAETQTGTDTARAVTPASLRACTATETRIGVVELATTAEVQTGTDTARAVTPAGLAARTATETRAGVVELATTAEAIAGSDTARAVTPAGLSAAMRPTTVAGHVRAGNMQLYNGATSYPSGVDYIIIDSAVAEDAWVTVGPTGSGATLTWDALDSLPSTARILMVSSTLFFESATASAFQYLELYAAAGGVTPTAATSAQIAAVVMHGQPTGSEAETRTFGFIPLNSSRVFQIRWSATAVANPYAALFYKGFITD